jgi:hypothetical protein
MMQEEGMRWTPWDVEVVYRPFGGEGEGNRYKAWKKSLKTMKDKWELSLRASAPGEYTIVGRFVLVCLVFVSEIVDFYYYWIL